jgi:hypothetical protein
MKHWVFVLLAISKVSLLCAQESVTIKEPAEQCYQDLKSNLPEAVGWDDAHMTVTSRPLMTTLSGNVYVVARILIEFGQDKKTKEKVEMCKIVVAIDAPEHSTAWNAMNSGRLRQQASLMKARIESTVKARKKKGD